jgi:2-desacetyl-2-hydroxyethyl bacteriochlorophyllide A dehydrogenase
MKALVARGKNDYQLENLRIPKIASGEILIKVEACGICAGDTKAWKGAPRFWGDENLEAYIEPPAIPGHEFVGEVVEIGEGVKGDFEIGDRVVSEQIVPCGKCVYCKTNRYSVCEKHDVYGFKGYLNGGMAEYVKLPKNSRNYIVPKNMPIEKAVLIEPFSCSKHCIDRADIKHEDVVVLAGAGTLGLGMVGAAKIKKPKKLIVLDMKKERLELATKFGADIVLNPKRDDVWEVVKRETQGYGCDIYIEATGHPSSIEQGLRLLRKQGTFVEFSVFKDKASIDWSVIGDGKELTIKGSSLSPECYETVIDWLAQEKLPADGVVTHRYKLDEWKIAFETAELGLDGAIKVIIER